MTVKDIIKIAATLLNREDIIKFVEGTAFADDSDTKKSVDTMTELLNLVINELSCAYVPMIKTEKVKVNGGKLYFNTLSENAINVIEALDANEHSLDFKLNSEYVVLPNSAEYVRYSYIPKKYSIGDTIGYIEKQISKRALAFGLCSEFCIAEAEFEKAVLWHDRYMDAIKEVCIPKTKATKPRRWN